jgi:predicted transcriptional regulator
MHAAARRTGSCAKRIVQFVEREEKCETLRQDAHQAWANYQATGLHAAQEEADNWLVKLENGEDAPAPLCRP